MANEDQYAVAIYHNTPVVYWEKFDDEVFFKHNNWKTVSTAAAMTFALEDNLGLENVRVKYSKKLDELFLVNKTTGYEETLNTYDGYAYNCLINIGVS